MACLACGRGFHDECENLGCESCHGQVDKLTTSLTTVGIGRGAPIKNQADLKDRKSTGRKRAAQLYPLFENESCEWRGKKNCGGGQPIVGCIMGLQTDRHHGPVKDPVHNEPGNVHRICSTCHNRWHAVNDPIYNEAEYKNTKHEPIEATAAELIDSDMHWRMKN